MLVAVSVPARGSDLNHPRLQGAGSGRVDNSQGVYRVIGVNRHGALWILSLKCSFNLAVEVDLPGNRSGHRCALPPGIDPAALGWAGVGQIWVDAAAVVLELVEQEGATQAQDPHPRSGRRSHRRGTQVGDHP